jgi:hypothetical protein
LYRFIRFFSQKLCICIALNDTFLSIAAQHCSYGTMELKENKKARKENATAKKSCGRKKTKFFKNDWYMVQRLCKTIFAVLTMLRSVEKCLLRHRRPQRINSVCRVYFSNALNELNLVISQ